MTTCVIPCCGRKLEVAAEAQRLYCSPNFRTQLFAAGRVADRVLILSALHGMVELKTVLKPYDLRMDQRGSITVEALAAQLVERDLMHEGDQALLPRAYFERLATACALAGRPAPFNHFEGTRGIGDQRSVTSRLRRAA